LNIDSRRSIKEIIVNQKSLSVWFTGISGSGKSTLAYELDSALSSQGFLIAAIDEDEVRKGLCANLDYTEEDKTENIRRVAEMSKVLVENGVIVINSINCPTQKMQQLAQNILGNNDFLLVYLTSSKSGNTEKGKFTKAGEPVKLDFSKIVAEYEIPKNPDLILDTAKHNIDVCVELLLGFLKPKIKSK
jgi:adenylylsulfate kinase